MKNLKINAVDETAHWKIKVEAASRKMTLKNFVIKAIEYVVDNNIKLN